MTYSTTGVIVAAHGRQHVVRIADGTRWACLTRGKRSDAACGDHVRVEQTSERQGVITEVLLRENLMYRSDAMRTKLLAANVSQLWVVVATEPAFSEDLLGRALVAAAALPVPARILLNKIDCTQALPFARAILLKYVALGYPVLEISVRGSPAEATSLLRPLLIGETTLFLGQSGMGKSSLLNLLAPDANARTREISEVLHSGKHTTTDARLYDLEEPQTAIIDTPGFQEFGLAHLTMGQIERAFPDFEPYLGHCKYYNCTHLAEPGCAVRSALEVGAIGKGRYHLFSELTRERVYAEEQQRTMSSKS